MMDPLSIFIIVVSVVLALAFKIFLYKRIQHWMDQDLIRGLAEGNSDKHRFLLDEYHQLRQRRVKRRDLSRLLTELAEQFEQKQ